jgi:uncharacterized protein (DUF952 family)
MNLLYKIVGNQEWQEAAAKGVFEGSAVDRRDGFIHLSAAHQVRATAAKHFGGQPDLVLVGFADTDLAQLKWEASRGGELFPHVYGPIATKLARLVEPLPRENGELRFPEGIA